METSDFRPVTAAAVVEYLKKPYPTLILYHVRSDADAVGSAFALSLWLSSMGSPACCVCADEIPERLRFLTDGQQASALPESIPAGFENPRVITVDTAAPGQLGALYERYAGQISLMIDHHRFGTPYADYYCVPDAAAAGEIVFDLMVSYGFDVPRRCAELLYAAISSDTGGFRYANTTAKTHLTAAALMKSGIDAANINRLLFDSKPFSLLRAEKAGFERVRLYHGGKVSILTFPYTLKAELGVREEDLETLIDVARCIAGVEVAVSIRQPENNDTFRVSMRSATDFDVAAICARFGGGGHTRAAGATLHAADIEEAEQMVLTALN